jgi:tetratricopeptide (TPR) repeat protein
MLRKLSKTAHQQADPLNDERGSGRTLVLPLALILAGIVLLAVLVGSFTGPASAPRSTQQVGSRPIATGPESPSAGDPRSPVISQARERLHDDPADRQTWAELGSEYLRQARITGDASYLPQAEGAFQRSLALDPASNWQAMTGLGELANDRHDFGQAVRWARRAAVAKPDNGTAYGVLADALTQLGDYPAATAAIRRMLDLRPGATAFTRAARHFAERGQTTAARRALHRALAAATERSDVSSCRYDLGELAFAEGDPKAALVQFQLGLTGDPSSDRLLAGRAKAEAALGRRGAALHDYAAAIARVPRPVHVLQNAELLLSLGRDAEAEQQFTLLAAEQKLLAANGVADHRLAAVVEADHGSATAAVRRAEAEWKRHPSPIVADTLGWALHRAGRDHEAHRYATRANRLNRRNATFAYHLGMINLALDRRAEARRNLRAALDLNPYFSVLQAPVARRALAAASGDH